MMSEKVKNKLWSVVAVVFGVGVIVLMCYLQGCNAWNYSNETFDAEGNLMRRVTASRCAWLMWGQADYVEIAIEPDGEWLLKIYDILVDPEQIKMITPGVIVKGGE